MKRFPLLLPLVAVVFAAACTDSTAPASSHALLRPNGPDLGVRGNPPPPPVDAAMTVCVGTAGCAPYTGTYFSNGTTIESAAAAAAIGDLSVTFDGTAWLKLDNKQPTPNGTTSANARFKRQDDKLSGMGTLVINGQVVVITDVIEFIPNESCQPGDPCAIITFKATVNGVPNQTGFATAFNKSTCYIGFGEGEGELVYYCGGS